MGLDDYSTFMTRSRPRGILSDADREYLRGEGSLSRQAVFERRKAIDERVFNGILDLHFLLKFFSDDGRQRLVDRDKRERLDLGPALVGATVFLWTFRPEIADEETILFAIDSALKKRGWVGEAEVNIDIERISRTQDSPRSFWGSRGGILSEPGGLVDRWKRKFERRQQQHQQPSALSPDQVSEVKGRFDELAEAYLSGESLSDDELTELASFLPEETEG